VNRKLTLNYGIRYDNNGNPYVDSALPGGSAPPNVIAKHDSWLGFELRVANCGRCIQSSVECIPSDRNWIFSRVLGLRTNHPQTGSGWFGAALDYSATCQPLGKRRESLGNNAPGPPRQPSLTHGSHCAASLRPWNAEPLSIRVYLSCIRGTPLNASGALSALTSRWPLFNRTWACQVHGRGSGALERQLTTNLTASFGYAGTHSSNLIIVWRQHGRHEL